MGNSRGRQLNLITQKIKNEHRTHWMQLTKIKQEITKRGDHHWWKLYTKVGNPKYNIKKKQGPRRELIHMGKKTHQYLPKEIPRITKSKSPSKSLGNKTQNQ